MAAVGPVPYCGFPPPSSNRHPIDAMARTLEASSRTPLGRLIGGFDGAFAHALHGATKGVVTGTVTRRSGGTLGNWCLEDTVEARFLQGKEPGTKTAYPSPVERLAMVPRIRGLDVDRQRNSRFDSAMQRQAIFVTQSLTSSCPTIVRPPMKAARVASCVCLDADTPAHACTRVRVRLLWSFGVCVALC